MKLELLAAKGKRRSARFSVKQIILNKAFLRLSMMLRISGSQESIRVRVGVVLGVGVDVVIEVKIVPGGFVGGDDVAAGEASAGVATLLGAFLKLALASAVVIGEGVHSHGSANDAAHAGVEGGKGVLPQVLSHTHSISVEGLQVANVALHFGVSGHVEAVVNIEGVEVAQGGGAVVASEALSVDVEGVELVGIEAADLGSDDHLLVLLLEELGEAHDVVGVSGVRDDTVTVVLHLGLSGGSEESGGESKFHSGTTWISNSIITTTFVNDRNLRRSTQKLFLV